MTVYETNLAEKLRPINAVRTFVRKQAMTDRRRRFRDLVRDNKVLRDTNEAANRRIDELMTFNSNVMDQRAEQGRKIAALWDVLGSISFGANDPTHNRVQSVLSRTAEIAKEYVRKEDLPDTIHNLCAECGVNVNVDEDGCCVDCGGPAYGDGLNQILTGLKGMVPAERAERLRKYVSHYITCKKGRMGNIEIPGCRPEPCDCGLDEALKAK